MLTELTAANFEAEVLKSDKPVLVDFWADWCMPCRMLSPVVDEVAKENPQIKVCKVNVSEQTELAGRFGVMSIPTLMFFKNGKQIDTSVGLVQKSVIEKLISQ